MRACLCVSLSLSSSLSFLLPARVSCSKSCLQEIDRIVQEDTQVLESFNELLSSQQATTPGTDAKVEDPRPPEEEVNVATNLQESAKAPQGPSCKIIDKLGSVSVQLHKDDSTGHYFLSSAADVKLPRGTKLASVGSGKPAEKADGKDLVGVPLAFPRGDRTWMELASNADPDDENAQKAVKKGTVYSVSCLDLKLLFSFLAFSFARMCRGC